MLEELQRQIRSLTANASAQELSRRTREVESLGSVLGDVTRSQDEAEAEAEDQAYPEDFGLHQGLSPEAVEARRRTRRLQRRTEAAIDRLHRSTRGAAVRPSSPTGSRPSSRCG